MNKKKKIIILGASGFLGGHVYRILNKNKFYKTVKASSSGGQNFLDLNKTQQFIFRTKPDVIINCASYGGSVHHVMKNHALVIKNNLLILINLYESVLKLSKRPLIINALANCSYSAKLNMQTENKWLEGPVHESVYSFGNITRMKYFIAKAWFEQYNLKSINLMFGGMYGPNDHLIDERLHAFDGIILRMVKAKLSRTKSFPIWGSGKPVREWIYVKDAARTMIQALQIKNTVLEPINVSQSLSLSINKIAKLIKKTLGYKGKIVHDMSYRDGAFKKVMGKGKRFNNFFPNFKFTKFDKAVKETVNYYLKTLKIIN